MSPAVLAPPAPAAEFTLTDRAALEYLLIGDLRQLLEEPPTDERNRWLIATLDMLLANQPGPGQSGYMAGLHRLCGWDDHSDRLWQERTVLYLQLQRLRDRLAHRAPCALIANEIRCDLGELVTC